MSDLPSAAEQTRFLERYGFQEHDIERITVTDEHGKDSFYMYAVINLSFDEISIIVHWPDKKQIRLDFPDVS